MTWNNQQKDWRVNNLNPILGQMTTSQMPQGQQRMPTLPKPAGYAAKKMTVRPGYQTMPGYRQPPPDQNRRPTQANRQYVYNAGARPAGGTYDWNGRNPRPNTTQAPAGPDMSQNGWMGGDQRRMQAELVAYLQRLLAERQGQSQGY